jgi:hypothetical protein
MYISVFKNTFILDPMRKICVIALSILFMTFTLSSCKSHANCAAYSKVNKINKNNVFVEKSQKEI